ncbi:hypothetical protein [Haloechinothrix halophila]|uniref:hypothetical protein n=1 Tax=Haloechinothrix halophila TaxID=1069073 RepID=UPI0012FAA790|nr:hypothetical protein [Haloechinothrix halophila]
MTAVASGFLIGSTDWHTAYIDSQFALHKANFTNLAEAHNSGAIIDSAPLPLTMRYLSLDGRAHLRTPLARGSGHADTPDVLYVPVWQNWRAEDGFGLAHFRFNAQPSPEISLMTASGDFGKPLRHLGGGWWVVD